MFDISSITTAEVASATIHFTTQNDIIAEAEGHASPGDTLAAQGFPFQWYMGQTVAFAFMSVHGAADGNHLYTSPGNETVTVGTTDLDVLVVYAPPGGFGVPAVGRGSGWTRLMWIRVISPMHWTLSRS